MTSVEKITQIIKEKGIAPTKMMRDLGFSSGLFTQWKQEKQKPSLSKLSKIAEYLGVPLFAITDSEFSFNPEDMISLSDIPDPDEGRTHCINEESNGGSCESRAYYNTGIPGYYPEETEEMKFLNKFKRLNNEQKKHLMSYIEFMLSQKKIRNESEAEIESKISQMQDMREELSQIYELIKSLKNSNI